MFPTVVVPMTIDPVGVRTTDIRVPGGRLPKLSLRRPVGAVISLDGSGIVVVPGPADDIVGWAPDPRIRVPGGRLPKLSLRIPQEEIMPSGVWHMMVPSPSGSVRVVGRLVTYTYRFSF